MKPEPFKLNNLDEVKHFIQRIEDYQNKNINLVLPDIDLIFAFEKLQNNPEGARIFSALLDIKLVYISMYKDLINMGNCNNILIHDKTLKDFTLLENQIIYDNKFEIFNSLYSFITKYRAAWDKIMGLLILIYKPDCYEKFSSAKSKKNEFKKIGSAIPNLPEKYADELHKALTNFDQTFRTPEVHGTGSLRKWAFSSNHVADTQLKILTEYMNYLIETLAGIDRIIKKI